MSDLSPEALAKLREWGQPVRDGLCAALTAPILALADRMDDSVATFPGEVTAMAATCQVDELPYAVSYYPDDLFNYCHSDGEPIPLDTPEKVDRHLAEYWPRHVADILELTGTGLGPERNPYEPYARREDLHARALTKAAHDDLRHRLLAGIDTPVGSAAWATYQQVASSQRERRRQGTGVYNLTYNAFELCKSDPRVFPFTLQAGALATLDAFSARNETYLLTESVSPFAAAAATIRVPIGEYGRRFADTLARTAWIQAHFTEYDERLRADVAVATRANPRLIADHTLRAYAHLPDGARPRPIVEGTVSTIQEGHISNLMAFALLTNRKVPGYEDDPVALMQHLARDGLVNTLARFIALNVVGGIVPQGHYPLQGTVERRGDRLHVQPWFKRLNRELNVLNQQVAYVHQQAIHEEGRPQAELPSATAARTGLAGCPFAFSPSPQAAQELLPPAVARLSQTTAKIFQLLSLQSASIR